MNDNGRFSISRRTALKLGASAIGVGAVSAITGMPQLTRVFAQTGSGGSATDWLQAAKWGVFNQGQMAEYQSPKITTISAWNTAVNNFDVDAVANQLQRLGAKYLIHGLGQNSGFYCSPNATYDRIVGYSPSHMSRRDLVSDLYAALNPRGITLMVYLPAGAPDEDSKAVTALKWQDGDYRLANFQVMWQDIIKEWSTRWGSKVAGWWFDGCWHGNAMYNFKTTPNWDSFAAAARSGNSASIIAFNPGVQVPIQAEVPQEDYTAGETDNPLAIFCNGRRVTAPTDATESANAQIQFHCLTYAGSGWGEGTSPVYTNAQLISATNAVVDGGGAITWDAPVSNPSGLIIPSFETAFAAMSDQLLGRYIVNDTSSSITYRGGTWNYSSSRGVGDYNDDVHYTTVNGAYAQFSFNGSGVQILSQRGIDMGNVAIYIDGVLMTTYNCYLTGGRRTQQVIYQVTGLTSGTHTAKVDGTYAILDAYRVLSTSSTVINDDHSGITYTGSWASSSGRNVTDVLQSVHYTSTNGDSFTYTFTGTGIEYITEKDSDMGDVEVFIDGASQGTYSCYATGGKLTQQPVFAMFGLSAGSHTIQVYNRSGGKHAILDALRVFV